VPVIAGYLEGDKKTAELEKFIKEAKVFI